MSDISDGIEKRILTVQEFKEAFLSSWNTNYPNIELPVYLPSEIVNFNRDISIPWSKYAMNAAISNYINNHDLFLGGVANELLPKEGIGYVLKTLKRVSGKILYNSIEAESIELTGYAVITGILKHYERILKMSFNDFNMLVLTGQADGYDVERRLFNRLGKRYIRAYQYAIEKHKSSDDFLTLELWLRIHLIVDHISGMTDEFALGTYQMLEGINLLRI